MSLILAAVSTLIAAGVAALFHQLVLAAVLGGAAVVLVLVLLAAVVGFSFAGYRRLVPAHSRGRRRRSGSRR